MAGPNTACTSTCTATWTYDARDRLVSHYSGHGTPNPTVGYTLNGDGSILTETKGATTRTFSYTGLRLETISQGASVLARHFYDPHGNLDCTTTSAGSAANCSPPEGGTPSTNLLTDYSYDGLDRLVGYRSYAGGTKQDSTTYVMDALDRVTTEIEDHAGTTKDHTTNFSYQGLTNLVTQEVLTGQVAGTKTFSYDAFGHRVSMTDTTETGSVKRYAYAYDVHGSASMLLEDTGTVKASYGYQPYGEADPQLSQGDTDVQKPLNPYRYTGKRLDSGSGSLDMGIRRFNPGSARFVQLDLLRSALSDLSFSLDPLTQNRYSLAGGNPVSFIEWDGHKVTSDGGGTAKALNDADDREERPTLNPEAHREMNFVYGPVLDLIRIDDALDAAKEFGVDPFLLITLMIKEGELRQLCEPCSEEFEKYQVANFENPSIGIVQMQFETFKETTKKHLESFGGPGPDIQYGVFDEWRLAFTERLRDERTAIRYAAAHLSDISAQVRLEDRSDPAVLAGVYNAGIQRYWDYYVSTGSFQSGGDNYVAAIRDPGGLYQEVRGMFS
jgi:RHS repeat-associated protein